MPWTNKSYPVTMKNLPAGTREKAIEIANAMLERNVDEGIAIATGIKNAKEWVKRRYYARPLL